MRSRPGALDDALGLEPKEWSARKPIVLSGAFTKYSVFKDYQMRAGAHLYG
jgi:hypothetical protein